MGALDFLSGGTPYNPQPVNMDADTSNLIDQSGSRAIAYKPGQSMEGAQEAQQSFAPSDARGPGNVAMSGALVSKYQKLAGEDLDQLNRQQNYIGQQRKAQMLQQSAHMAYARQQVANQNYARMIAAYNNQVAARAQVISSVLGLGGMGAGMMIGGPAGAVAGGMAGNAAAKSTQNTASNGYSSNDTALA